MRKRAQSDGEIPMDTLASLPMLAGYSMNVGQTFRCAGNRFQITYANEGVLWFRCTDEGYTHKGYVMSLDAKASKDGIAVYLVTQNAPSHDGGNKASSDDGESEREENNEVSI